ncbi:MAG: hypothetical protein V4576_04010 [Patescibacteria group bacterium]
MKSFQKLLVILIIAAVVLCIATYIYKHGNTETTTTIPPTQTATETNTPTAPVVNASSTKKVPVKVTEREVRGATYLISARFDGKETIAQKVVFPVNGDAVYMSSEGQIIQKPATVNSKTEMFKITGFKFTDATETVAEVTIQGTYAPAASTGADVRTFTAWNTDGVIVTTEIKK